MKIKPLKWAEFQNGTGYLAVTPINTTYAIYKHAVSVGMYFSLYFNGSLVNVDHCLDVVQGIATKHHRQHLMACFEDAES